MKYWFYEKTWSIWICICNRIFGLNKYFVMKAINWFPLNAFHFQSFWISTIVWIDRRACVCLQWKDPVNVNRVNQCGQCVIAGVTKLQQLSYILFLATFKAHKEFNFFSCVCSIRLINNYSFLSCIDLNCLQLHLFCANFTRAVSFFDHVFFPIRDKLEMCSDRNTFHWSLS